MAATLSTISWLDYTVICLSFIAYGATGVYYAISSPNASSSEYFEGGRQLKMIPTAVSLFASFTSAIALISIPGEIYTVGCKYMMQTLGELGSIAVAALVFIPALYPLNIVSVYEYLELRYKSRLVRILGSLLAFLSQLIYMSNATFAPCTALEAMTGISAYITMPVTIAMAAFYTTLGGIRAVVWVDLLQAIVMILGLLVMTIIGVVTVGGFGNMFDIANDWGRLNFFEVSATGPTGGNVGFPTMAVGFFVSATYWWGLVQTGFQRYHSLPTMRDAQKGMLLSATLSIVFKVILLFASLSMFAYYTELGCDPLASGAVEKRDQLMPQYLADVMNYPPIPGIYIAGLFSGALSTLSSGYNAMAALIWEDCLKTQYKAASDRKVSIIIKSVTIFIAVLSLGLAFLFSSLNGSIIQIMFTFNGLFEGVQIGIFLLGLSLPFMETKGILAGSVVGLGLPLWIALGQTIYGLGRQVDLNTTVAECCDLSLNNVTGWCLPGHNETVDTSTGLPDSLELLYSLSYYLFPLLSFVIYCLVAIPVSLFFSKSETDISPELIPLYHRMCCRSGAVSVTDSETDSQTLDVDSLSPKKTDFDMELTRKTVDL